jgi:hypothetical protein
MHKLFWKCLLSGTLGVGLIYPLALVPVILADTLTGEAEFLRRILYASDAETAAILIGDWWSALPVALACWVLIRIIRTRFALRQVSLVGGGIAAIGIVLALVPPYVPMILAAMILSTVLVNLLFERRGILS